MKKFYTFKFLLAAMLVAFAGNAAAETVTFDFASNAAAYGGTSDGAAVTEFSEGGITVTVGKEANPDDETASPQQSKMYNNQFRFYKWGTLTLDAGDKQISSVQFVCDSKYPATRITFNGTALGEDGIWSGTAASTVTFGNTAQARITKMVVALDGADIEVPTPVTPTYTLPYENSMLSDNGDFTVDNKSLGEGITYVWQFHSSQGAKASAYNKAAYASESWLISPIFDLTGEAGATLSFEHATNKFASADGAKQAVSLLVREDGSDSWTALTIPEFSTNSDWTYIPVSIDLAAYAGKKIQLAFKYTSTESNCGTWEIINFGIHAAGFVKAPTFDPEGGTYLESVSVTLEAEDGCSIYYSTDGSEPTTPYLGAITLTENATIRAIAEDEDGETSEVAEAAYTIIHLKDGQTAKFDFAANEWELPVSTNATGDGATGNITEPIENADGVVLAFTSDEEASNKPRMWQGTTYTDLRMYNGNGITVTAPEGREILQIFFFSSAKDKVALTAEDGQTVSGVKVTDAEVVGATLDGSKYFGVYTPAEGVEEVSFTASATNYITEMNVILSGGSAQYDLNEDGSVDVSDVTTLVSAVLAGSTEARFDLNQDGSVDVSDVTTLVSAVLNQ